MPVEAKEILDQLTPLEDVEVEYLDKILTANVRKHPRRRYIYTYSPKNYEASTLNRVKDIWVQNGWICYYDSWTIYLELPS